MPTTHRLSWLKNKLGELNPEKAKELARSTGIFYRAHRWTPLKLIFLMFWVQVYTRIIPKYFSNFYYIDLLAGPGINFIQETNDYVMGSPLIAVKTAYKPFTRHFFFEINKKGRKALRNCG